MFWREIFFHFKIMICDIVTVELAWNATTTDRTPSHYQFITRHHNRKQWGDKNSMPDKKKEGLGDIADINASQNPAWGGTFHCNHHRHERTHRKTEEISPSSSSSSSAWPAHPSPLCEEASNWGGICIIDIIISAIRLSSHHNKGGLTLVSSSSVCD